MSNGEVTLADEVSPKVKRDSLNVKPGSLTAMMLEPAMINLRETWMGAYYINELSRRTRNMELKV